MFLLNMLSEDERSEKITEVGTVAAICWDCVCAARASVLALSLSVTLETDGRSRCRNT